MEAQRERQLDLGSLYSVVRFSGSDARDFLQRQLTNDIAGLDTDTAQVSAMLTPKGRVIAILTLIEHDNEILALVDSNMAVMIGQTLSRYVIRSDVQIEAPDPAWQVRGRLLDKDGNDDPRLDALPLSQADHTLTLNWPGNRQILVSRNGPDGDDMDQCLQRWQLLDIQHNLARIGPTLSEQFVPQMLLLDQMGAVSFKKGCYPGQEVVARTHYRGRIKRKLVQYTCGAALAPDTTLAIGKPELLQPVGKTLQQVAIDDRQWSGLAVVHENAITTRKLVATTQPAVDVLIV